MSGEWIDITEIGSPYFVQLHSLTGARRHRPMRLKGSVDDDDFMIDMQAIDAWRDGPPPKK